MSKSIRVNDENYMKLKEIGYDGVCSMNEVITFLTELYDIYADSTDILERFDKDVLW